MSPMSSPTRTRGHDQRVARQCTGTTKSGNRCDRMTKRRIDLGTPRCYTHGGK